MPAMAAFLRMSWEFDKAVYAPDEPQEPARKTSLNSSKEIFDIPDHLQKEVCPMDHRTSNKRGLDLTPPLVGSIHLPGGVPALLLID
jgi:hypothetical protein